MKSSNAFNLFRKTVYVVVIFVLLGSDKTDAQSLLGISSSEGNLDPTYSREVETNLLALSADQLKKGDLGSALQTVNTVLKKDSQNPRALLQRGLIYAQQKQWDKADYDYEVALIADPANVAAKFSLAELNFEQKKYDEARAGFARLEKDDEVGDFSIYKVFLCDLFGAHEQAANKDLQALDDVGGNPSYYFGNAAWDLVHKKNDDAKDWLTTAARIYSDAPQKYANYTASLKDLGYLPISVSSSP